MLFRVAVVLLAAVSQVAMAIPQTTAPTVVDKNSFTERELYDRHIATVGRIYSNMIASNKAKTVLSSARTLPPLTFSRNVVGRIWPFGLMSNLDETMDYFWGAFGANSPALGVQILPEVLGYNITAFASTGSAAHAFIDLLTADFNGGTAKIRAQAMFLFDETPAGSVVSQYDVYYVASGGYLTRVRGEINKFDLLGQTCTAQRKVCGNGLKDPWPLLNCEVAMTFKDEGDMGSLSDDSILCRAVETNLAYLPNRKSVHCANLGPSGGNRCVKQNYRDYFKPIGRPFTDTPSTKEAANAQLQKDYKEAQYTVFNVYNKTIFPGNQEWVRKGIVPARTFSNSTSGRIWPIGLFTNTEDTVEYQFGIFGSLNEKDVASGLIPVINSFKINAFVNNGKVAATSIDYEMLSTVTKQLYPLRVQGFWRLDDAYEVDGYDVQVHNSGAFYSEVAFNLPTFLTKTALATAICISQAEACKGENQVYGGPGQPDCFPTLAFDIPFGRPNEVMADSVQCRSIHVNLAFLRPEVHCKHVSVSGGGKCEDKDYLDYFSFPFKAPFKAF
ncbi:hypothetical protein HDU96_007410 [Phlyctochytrium bullatum]|nr:hypothetical protein HDU96_007410 [Phlyctochytrium bullatum]